LLGVGAARLPVLSACRTLLDIGRLDDSQSVVSCERKNVFLLVIWDSGRRELVKCLDETVSVFYDSLVLEDPELVGGFVEAHVDTKERNLRGMDVRARAELIDGYNMLKAEVYHSIEQAPRLFLVAEIVYCEGRAYSRHLRKSRVSLLSKAINR
jgi:hypothetical protein